MIAGLLALLGRFLPGPLVLALLALLAGGALGGWAGWSQGRAPLRTEIAELRQAHAEQARLASQASAQRLSLAQALGESLSAQLSAQLATNHQLTQEKTLALKAATSGRACLSQRALGLLHGAPGISVAPAPRMPAPQPTAAAAGAPVATDTDLAGWVLQAGAAHEACRARLNALIAWHQQPAQPTPPTQPAALAP